MIISSSSSIICRLSHSSFVSTLSFTKVMGRGGGCLFEWGVGAYLGEGAYYRVGALFEEIWYVLVFVWYTLPLLFLPISAKKKKKKTLWHHLFPFVQKQKQTCLFCKISRVGHFIKLKKNNSGISIGNSMICSDIWHK